MTKALEAAARAACEESLRQAKLNLAYADEQELAEKVYAPVARAAVLAFLENADAEDVRSAVLKHFASREAFPGDHIGTEALLSLKKQAGA